MRLPTNSFASFLALFVALSSSSVVAEIVPIEVAHDTYINQGVPTRQYESKFFMHVKAGSERQSFLDPGARDYSLFDPDLFGDGLEPDILNSGVMKLYVSAVNSPGDVVIIPLDFEQYGFQGAADMTWNNRPMSNDNDTAAQRITVSQADVGTYIEIDITSALGFDYDDGLTDGTEVLQGFHIRLPSDGSSRANVKFGSSESNFPPILEADITRGGTPPEPTLGPDLLVRDFVQTVNVSPGSFTQPAFFCSDDTGVEGRKWWPQSITVDYRSTTSPTGWARVYEGVSYSVQNQVPAGRSSYSVAFQNSSSAQQTGTIGVTLYCTQYGSYRINGDLP